MRSILIALVLAAMCSSALAAGPPIRKWTSIDGKHSAMAQYVSVRGEAVRLRIDGKRLKDIPLAKLSVADNQYVGEEIRKAFQKLQDVENLRKAAAALNGAAPLVAPARPQAAAAAPPVNVAADLAKLNADQGRLDAEGTAINDRLTEIYAEGQSLRTEYEGLQDEILRNASEADQRNDEIAYAREHGMEEVIITHQNQLLLLRDRLSALRVRRTQVEARFSGLDAQARRLQGQLAEKIQQYEYLEEEKAAMQP